MENCTPEQCTVKDTKAGQDVTCQNTDQGSKDTGFFVAYSAKVITEQEL